MVDLSKLFKNAVINLYKSNVYTVDYAIIESSKLADKNKINAKDYEKLITYLAEEQEKSMQEIEEKEKTTEIVDIVDTVEETTESTDNITEEITEETEQIENKKTKEEEV